jgi:hypothetical protein
VAAAEIVAGDNYPIDLLGMKHDQRTKPVQRRHGREVKPRHPIELELLDLTERRHMQPADRPVLGFSRSSIFETE